METKTTYRPERAFAVQAKKAFRLLISGGGTGGHVFPAIAIADAIKALQPNTEFLFIGAQDRLEMERVPKAGYPIEGLWISGFQRKLSIQNLMFPFKLLSSLIKADRLVRTFKPDVVVGVGGYASGPTLDRAQRLGIPTLIQEQNSFPGVTNRLLAKKADRICVAYAGMERFFPAEKIQITGNPVRQDLLEPLPESHLAKQQLGLDSKKPLIVVVGGSLGARSMNEAMEASAMMLENRQDVEVIWQAGKLYLEEFQKTATAQLPNVQLKSFLEDMPGIFAAADVLVCRAGAITITEICTVGKAAVLVPSPNVAEDHQTKNANALVENGAAILVPDKEAPDRMIQEALQLLENKDVRKSIEQRAKAMSRPKAGIDIAEAILELGRQKN